MRILKLTRVAADAIANRNENFAAELDKPG
jgi:hypothetical protein